MLRKIPSSVKNFPSGPTYRPESGLVLQAAPVTERRAAREHSPTLQNGKRKETLNSPQLELGLDVPAWSGSVSG